MREASSTWRRIFLRQEAFFDGVLKQLRSPLVLRRSYETPIPRKIERNPLPIDSAFYIGGAPLRRDVFYGKKFPLGGLSSFFRVSTSSSPLFFPRTKNLYSLGLLFFKTAKTTFFDRPRNILPPSLVSFRGVDRTLFISEERGLSFRSEKRVSLRGRL